MSYAITVDGEDARLIGEVQIWATGEPGVYEIGYWVDPKFQEREIMTAAVAAIGLIAFEELGAVGLVITTDPQNAPSSGIPIKLGFRHQGVVEWWQTGATPPRKMTVRKFVIDEPPVVRFPSRPPDREFPAAPRVTPAARRH